MYKIIVLFLGLLWLQNSAAQTILLVDMDTQKPIEAVYVYGEGKSTVSNHRGVANLAGFQKGAVIKLQHSTYAEKTIEVPRVNRQDTILLQSIVFPINEVVVAANKWEQKTREIPSKVVTIKSSTIRQTTAATTADLLKSTNQVFIQKSQMGGGSPMIRGFAANRVLLVLDGVRLNNAIYRSGNLQNVINIDPNSLASAEVVLGAGSVIYGSDAIGGVMDFHTIKPKFSTTEKLYAFLNYKNRFASATGETTNHADYNIGSQQFSFAGSVSFSRFGDLEMGSHGSDSYLRPDYVETQNNEDKIVANSNPEKQVYSGYSQFNSVQKIRYKINENSQLSYGLHYTITSDVPRYDRLIQTKKGKLKYAQWYYGEQKIHLHTLQFQNKTSNSFYDSFRAVAGYQYYTESRNDRKIDQPTLRTRTEKLNIFTLNVDAEKHINRKSQLFYGAEYTYNHVGSLGVKKHLTEYTKEIIASRYPDNSSQSGLAFYADLKWKLQDKWIVNTGMRYSHSWIDAQLSEAFYHFPFHDLDMNTGAVNGCLGITHETTNGWLLKLNTSTGFRAPNIDDVAKVFDSEPGKVVVPNKDLKSEYIYSIEGNVSKKIGNHFYFDFNLFYSYLKDAMTRADYTFNQQDSIFYDGEMSRVQAIVNRDNAKVWGVNLLAMAKISDTFKVKAQVNYTQGEYKNGTPVRHVPPVFGIMEFCYHTKRLVSKLTVEYNGEISYHNLAESERSKSYLYPKNSAGKPYCPQWATLNWNNNINITPRLHLNIAVENIFDKRYRAYSSGICAPGRNFIVGVAMKVNS